MHDKELTYSYVCPSSGLENGDSIMGSYREILQIFIDRFKKFDIDLEVCGQKHPNNNINYCMLVSSSADLCYKGKKLIGSAQFRKDGYILQHGSILMDYDEHLLEELFQEKIPAGSITSIKEINPDISMVDILHLWDNL